MTAVKCGGESGDEIEFSAEIGQRFKRSNGVNEAVDFEKIDQPVEYRNAADVEAQAGVTQSMGDKEEKPAAATDIQNFPRRKPVQVQILRPPDVLPKMFFDLEIFGIMTPQAR